MSKITIATSGLNAVDSPGPGVPVLRSLKESKLNHKRLGLAYDVLEPGSFMHGLIEASYIMPLPASGPAALLKRLSFIQEKEALQVVIPTLDAELENYISLNHKLEEMNIYSCLPTMRAFKMRDKVHLAENIDDALVGLPKTFVLQDISALRQVLSKIDLPVFLKGRFYDAYLARSIDEAVGLFHLIASRWGLPVLAQAQVKGEECNVVALAKDGRSYGQVAMKKLYLTDKGKAWAGVTIENRKILQITSQLVKQLGWSGACEFEFIIENETNKIYLLEINPRFPAWVYLATQAGVNLPERLVKLALGLQVDGHSDYQVGKVFVRHSWDEIIDMSALDALSTTAELHHE